MKRKWLASLFTVVVISLLITPNVHAVPVYFEILDNSITTGEAFDVAVSVVAADASVGDLTSFGFDITAGSLFSYTGYRLGAGFDDGADNVGTSTHIEGFFNDQAGNTGQDILLATLSFVAGDIAGDDLLQVGGVFNMYPASGLSYGNFMESIFTDLDIDLSLAEININPGTAPVPEPATIFLLSAGLVGVCGLKKRFKK